VSEATASRRVIIMATDYIARVSAETLVRAAVSYDVDADVQVRAFS